MKRFLFLGLVGVVLVVCGVAANSVSRARTQRRESTVVPVTKIAIEPSAPISIRAVTKDSARVFKVEIVNVSSKTIQGFEYTYYKRCETATIPAGRFVGFPETVLKPREELVFDAGEDAPVRETDIQNCLDTAKEIWLQIKTVTFGDGTVWKAVAGDFPGIKSPSP